MSEGIANSGSEDAMGERPEGEGPRFARAHHVLLLFALATLVIWLLSGIYQVKTDQIAIVERLGKFVSNADGKVIHTEHGLHYHMPWPIDRVHLISVQQVFTLQVSAFNASPTEYEEFKIALMRTGNSAAMLSALFDPYLITADKSVAHVEVSVLFRINDPEAWLTSVSHEYLAAYNPAAKNDMRNELFQQISQRVITSQVSRMTLEKVVRDGRAELERGILNALQQAMHVPDPADHSGATMISLGVQIQSVAISEARVPDAVKGAYDNLNTQRARAETVKKTADADATAMTARAEGEKSTLLADAESYRQSKVQTTKGEADRFSQVLEQYYNAPAVTRSNLYVEAATLVTGAAKRLIFAQPGQRTVITVEQPQYDATQVLPSGQGQPRQ